MHIPISVEPWAYICAAAGLLLLPLDWLISGFMAAAVHECCHIAAIHLCGGKVHGIHIGGTGAEIKASLPASAWEIPCALAGPAGSLLLISLCNALPKVAICGFIQGLFNLLPLFPLDGGRVVWHILKRLFPENSERICKKTQAVLFGVFTILVIWISVRLSIGLLPAALLICRGLAKKTLQTEENRGTIGLPYIMR